VHIDSLDVVLDRDWIDYTTLAIALAAAAGTVFAVWVSVIVAGRDRRERRKRQAEAISAWPERSEPGAPPQELATLVVKNGSSSSVYDVLMVYAGAWGSLPADKPIGRTKWLTTVPPGLWEVSGPPYEGEAMDYRTGVLIEFTDASGACWRRTARGDLLLAPVEWFQEQKKGSKPENRSLTRITEN
jgi:hypothetical protein